MANTLPLGLLISSRQCNKPSSVPYAFTYCFINKHFLNMNVCKVQVLYKDRWKLMRHRFGHKCRLFEVRQLNEHKLYAMHVFKNTFIDYVNVSGTLHI